MYKLAQPLSRTMLIHYGAFGERQRETERDRETETERQRDRDREKETERKIKRQTETERDREGQRERERQREMYINKGTWMQDIAAHNREHKINELQGTDINYTTESIALYKVDTINKTESI